MPSQPRPSAQRQGAQRRHSRRFVWVGLVTLLLLAGGGLIAQRYLDASTTPTYRTATVALGNLDKTVTALGSLQPRDYVDVGAQVSGQLQSVRVEIGDRVKRGQLLAEIDARVFESQVAADRAQVQVLEAQIKQQEAEAALARRQANRSTTLHGKKLVTDDAHETLVTAAIVAEARLEELQAQLEQAKSSLEGDLTNLEFTKIYAPLTGTVVSQEVVEGQTLNANQTAPMLLRIADLETMTVWAQVSEADVVRLAVGTPAYFTTLGLPERRWEGTVRQIRPTPQIVNDVVLYDVLIDVDNADGVLMSEMTAQVFFVLGRAEQVPLVPVAALQPLAEGGHEVRVLTPNGPETRRVEVGLMNRSEAAVVSGLTVGELVILGEQTAAQPRASQTGGGVRRIF